MDHMEGGNTPDRISGLPDDLLHSILLRLHSAHSAARTTVLSRRWRHVWATLPELALVGPRARRGRQPNSSPLLLRLRPASLLSALTDLKIRWATMEAPELESLVSSQCPVLRDLTLHVMLVAFSDVSIRSGSLRRLEFNVRKTSRLEVAAPMLEVFVASSLAGSYISAPKLAEAEVHSLHRHQFADPGRRLRRLGITQCYHTNTVPPGTRRLDAVDELRLHAYIGRDGYNSFLDDTNNLPKYENLSVSLIGDYHGFVPCMLHLLRRGDGIRKLVLENFPSTMVISKGLHDGRCLYNSRCELACPCRLPESYRANDITLDSLEEIEINSFTGADAQVEFLKLLLSRCTATKLICLEINKSHRGPLLRDEVAEKIRSICHPNLRVRLHVISKGRLSELILQEPDVRVQCTTRGNINYVVGSNGLGLLVS